MNVATEIETLNVGQYYGARAPHAQSHGEAFLANPDRMLRVLLER